MKLNSVEWGQAQDLLVKLVHVLSPLTLRTVPTSFFLNSRFLIPSDYQSAEPHSLSLRHPVRLLTTLHSVQKQVEEFLGEVPFKEPSIALPSQAKETASLPKQVQSFIAQVQKAIGKLATFENIQNPQEAPLREELAKLKPDLDRIIETVLHQQEAKADFSPKTPSFRHPIPSPSRAEILKRPPSAEDLLQKLRTEPHQPPSFLKQKKELERGEEKSSIPRTAKDLSDKESIPALLKETQENLSPETRNPKEGQTSLKPAQNRIDPITILGAPFVSPAKNLTPPRKKRKKGFWHKREEEEDKPNS
jgi:hypothetical protein